MTKVITLLLLSRLMISVVTAQCVPNAAYTAPGIYPDSASGFPPAVATYEYNLVITAVIPADTILFPFPQLPIDSIGVKSITGLPEGFEALPNRPSGFWHGGTSGCMLITGTPGHDQVGHYPLIIKVDGYMGGLGYPFPHEITFYSITVFDSTAYGITSSETASNIRLAAYPNPFTNKIMLEFYAFESGLYDLLIYNTDSRLIQKETIKAVKGKTIHETDGSHLKPGIYICRLMHRERKISTAIKLVKY